MIVFNMLLVNQVPSNVIGSIRVCSMSESIKVPNICKAILAAFFILSFYQALDCNNARATPSPTQISLWSSINENDVEVRWSFPNTNIYGAPITVSNFNIYRDTVPTFIPDYQNGSNRLAQVSESLYSDPTALLSTENYFYLVTAVSEDGTEAIIPSNLGCKIRLEFTFDSDKSNKHWISILDNADLQTASDIASLSSNISQVIRWDATTQTEQIWDVENSSGVNFSVLPGEPYAIVITADTVINLVGTYNTGSIPLAFNQDNFSLNWVNLPPDTNLVNASDLSSSVTDTTKVAKYDQTNDTYSSWFNMDDTWKGENFTIEPGLGVAISVTGSSTFVPHPASPKSNLLATPDKGYESIAVDISAAISLGLSAIDSVQWDFEGDGVFDLTESTNQIQTFTYSFPGTYHPTALVTDVDGRRALAYQTVSIESLGVTFSAGSFNPEDSETLIISYTLPVDGAVTVLIYDSEGNLIRTLLSSVSQSAGEQSVSWDGLSDDSELLPDGSYYTVIQLTIDGHTSIYDTRQISGDVDISGNVTGVNVSSNLSPLTGEYVDISFILPEASKVTVNITDPSKIVLRHLLQEVILPAGNHTVVWDGADDSGQFLSPGNTFKVDIIAISLSSNNLIISGQQPVLSNVNAGPLRFSPATNPYGQHDNSQLVIEFTSNKQVDVTGIVRNTSGQTIANLSISDAAPGANQLIWGGRKSNNLLAAKGIYTVELQAIDDTGQSSNNFYVSCEIFY